jgi:tripartite-type tricarboxylate transporter receptor subunit TctC
MPKAPEVPTMEEATGFKDFDVRTWFGLAAPAGMPGAIVGRLNEELRRAVAMPEIRARLEQIGGEVSPGTPQEFRARVEREHRMWSKVVDDINFPRQ